MMDFKKHWENVADYLWEIEGAEVDNSGNFIDKDGSYIEILNCRNVSQLNAELYEDYEECIKMLSEFKQLSEEEQDKWLSGRNVPHWIEYS